MSNPGTPEGFGIHVDAPAFAPSSSCRLARTKTILFVCTGNICRSPMAEGLFRHAVKGKGDYRVLSAGVGAVAPIRQPEGLPQQVGAHGVGQQVDGHGAGPGLEGGEGAARASLKDQNRIFPVQMS